jgi:hypothetical protein
LGSFSSDIQISRHYTPSISLACIAKTWPEIWVRFAILLFFHKTVSLPVVVSDSRPARIHQGAAFPISKNIAVRHKVINKRYFV